MKKVFVITMFGTPFSWINEYIENVQHLEKYGWYWKIFTPNGIESKGNVEIVPMSMEDFNVLVEKKTGVRPNFFMTIKGCPSVHITDYYVASGVIFEDYLKDADFWGITNLDVVYGRLDKFVSDKLLRNCDIFTDDTNKTVNGVFSLWRNIPEINNLFRKIPNWEEKFGQAPCPVCLGFSGGHTLFGTDEYEMSLILKNEPLNVIDCEYYPLHGHDRLEQHLPEPKLEIKHDGSLWELSKDVNGPEWVHARPFIGREIMYFHFPKTKKWPSIKTISQND